MSFALKEQDSSVFNVASSSANHQIHAIYFLSYFWYFVLCDAVQCLVIFCGAMQCADRTLQAKSTNRDKLIANKLIAKRRFCYSNFVTDFVAVISSQSEGLGKMALGILKIYLGSPFSANRRCPQSVGLRSVCRGQLPWIRTLAVQCGRSAIKVCPLHL